MNASLLPPVTGVPMGVSNTTTAPLATVPAVTRVTTTPHTIQSPNNVQGQIVSRAVVPTSTTTTGINPMCPAARHPGRQPVGSTLASRPVRNGNDDDSNHTPQMTERRLISPPPPPSQLQIPRGVKPVDFVN